MAGFKTHLTFSGVLGVGYGGAAFWFYGVPWPTCVLAGGLCGLSGMLPDLDSDSSEPVRESMAFAAAVAPMMLLHRLQQLGFSHEAMVLLGAAMYVLVRFGAGSLLKRFTVHRGMFHSLPTAIVFGELTFLLASGDDLRIRGFKAGAVVIGYVSHLLLDELYSVEWRRGHLRLKHSFGTALKLFSSSRSASLLAYGHLLLLAALIFCDPATMHAPNVPGRGDSIPQAAARTLDQLLHR
ncbi:MAG: metal-dependent hydrolase [Planctomycetaceae bacterium]|nr:metal-dependent hydrolase [Planctomycetaceae bacterium]